VAGGKVASFDGDLDDYRRRVLSDRDGDDARSRTERSARPLREAENRASATERRVGARQLRERVARAEAEISRLGREIEKLDAALADGGLFARDPAKAAVLAKTRSVTAAALAQAEEDWLAAGEALQAAMN
jgi:ATP-binding cassette subfamily F protein 3